MTKAQSKKPAAKKSAIPDKPELHTENMLSIIKTEGKSKERLVAEVALHPVIGSASTAQLFTQSWFGKIGLDESVGVMARKADKVLSGDLSEVEAMLTAQAVALDAIFNHFANRAQIADYIPKMETYMRLALKAQSQCRTTVEAIAEIKYPKSATFIRQANVGENVQVNNGQLAAQLPAHEKTVNPVWAPERT